MRVGRRCRAQRRGKVFVLNVGFVTGYICHRGGGVAETVNRLAIELACVPDINVSVYGTRDQKDAVDPAHWPGVRLNCFDVMGPMVYCYAPGIRRAMFRSGMDLMHGHGLWGYSSTAARAWAVRKKKPYLVSPHGTLDAWVLRKSRLKKRIAAWVYEYRNLTGATCLHALTEDEARSMRAFGLSNPIAVVPNGILPSSPRAFTSLPERPARSCAPRPHTLLFLARLHPKKGLENLLGAWHDLQAMPAAQGWHLQIAGWSEDGHEAELKALAHALDIEQSISFIGPRFDQDKEALFGSAAAFILPSFSEGMPMTVLEAWAAGLPVVMTRECNLSIGFRDGAALEIRPQRESIAAGLRQLFAMTDDELTAMGSKGRMLVEREFLVSRTALRMAEVYRWVLGGGSPPSCVMTD